MSRVPVTIGEQKRLVRIIWGAMLNAVVVYGVVCLFISKGWKASDEDATRWLRYAFSLLGIGLGALSLWWRRHYLSTTPESDDVVLPMPFTQLLPYTTIMWAFTEAVALCGFVLALMVHDFREFVPFGAAAAALFLMHRPDSLPWERVSDATP